MLIALDAGGLSLFTIAGATKALAYKINPFVAVLMGVITGVGGGTIRDILLARIPAVLRADVYAQLHCPELRSSWSLFIFGCPPDGPPFSGLLHVSPYACSP